MLLAALTTVTGLDKGSSPAAVNALLAVTMYCIVL